MAILTRPALLLSVLLAAALPLRAQQPIPTDRPEPFVPVRAEAKEDLDRREARKLYALGVLRQRQDRLLDALRCLEEARTLDPDAVALHRQLIPLYLALGRGNDALTSTKEVLDRDPADFHTWYALARQLRDMGRNKEAIDALAKGVKCPGVEEELELLVQMRFDLGVLHEDAKDYAAAETAFNGVIDILVGKRDTLLDNGPFNPEALDTESAKTYERIGQVCIQAGKYDRAVNAFLAAQKCDPDRAGRLNYNLAEVRLAEGKPASALPFLDEFLKTQPQDSKPYELKISILKQLGRDGDILPALRQHAERDEHNVGLQLLLCKQYTKEKQWAEAERRYQKLAEESPTPEVYRGLFALYAAQSREPGQRGVNKALDVLDQAVSAATPKDETKPGDPSAAARARAMVAVLREDPEAVKSMLSAALVDLRNRRERAYDTWRLLGALATRAKQLDYAEQLYRQCLARITPATEAEVYGGLLDILMEQRKYEEVVKVARAGLERAQATNRILFHVKLAGALAFLDKKDEALAQASEAVKVADDRNRLRMRRFRAEILRQIGRYDEGIKECEELFKEYHIAGEVRDIRYTLSGIYSTAKQNEKSEEQLRLILQDDPNDATANNDLGYIMADQGKNLEESEKLVRKAIELDRQEKKSNTDVRGEPDGDNAAYLDSLGWVLFRRGKMEEARDWLEKAIALDGGLDDPVVWDHLGDVYFRLGQTVKARATWQKAVRLYEQEKRRKADDRYEEVKEKLRQLESGKK